MRVILVPIADRPECAVALTRALELAQAFNSNVVGCHIRPHRDSAVKMPGGLISSFAGSVTEWEANTRGQDAAKNSRAARALFARLAGQFGLALSRKPVAPGKRCAIWEERVGSPMHVLPIIGPMSDLLVVSRPTAKGGRVAWLFVLEALLHSCRPVLILPQNPIRPVGRRIAIAWNQSAEASRALAATMPLLRKAESVSVIAGGAENLAAPKSTHVVEYLAHYGISARRLATPGRSPEEELVAAYRETRSDLLVMGAYSRHRFRELVFGGVTEYMLRRARIPVLMYHS